MGRTLRYDFSRLQADLLGEGIVSVVDFGGRLVAQACAARVLVDYWADRIREDPFYLLDGESRSWAEPFYESRQRRFLLEDFE